MSPLFNRELIVVLVRMCVIVSFFREFLRDFMQLLRLQYGKYMHVYTCDKVSVCLICGERWGGRVEGGGRGSLTLP